jgi:hypothetical protein
LGRGRDYVSRPKTKLLACAVVVEELRARLPAEIDCETLDFGLHRSPELLRGKLQETIDRCTGYDNIVLAYGLCGMAVVGLRSDSATLIVPRADDCIAIFLGSRQAYLKEQNDHPGSLFLSKGWIEGRIEDVGPTAQMLETLVAKYGEDRAMRMLSVFQAKQPLRHYRRLAFITTSGESNLDHYKGVARARAANLGLHYAEIQGSTAFMDKIAHGSWDDHFLVVSPGRRVAFDGFWGDAIRR